MVFILYMLSCGLVHGQSTLSSLHSICNNFISISGETNLNSFELQQKVPDHLICGADDSQWVPVPEEKLYMITIPVHNFIANNSIVYKDFLKLVNAPEHPNIFIFISEDQLESLFKGRSSYSPTIGVFVNGVTRTYKIPCQISDCFDGKITLSGSTILMLTDFKLDPPQKSLGLIKVQNELIVKFEFGLPSKGQNKLTKT